LRLRIRVPKETTCSGLLSGGGGGSAKQATGCGLLLLLSTRIPENVPSRRTRRRRRRTRISEDRGGWLGGRLWLLLLLLSTCIPKDVARWLSCCGAEHVCSRRLGLRIRTPKEPALLGSGRVTEQICGRLLLLLSTRISKQAPATSTGSGIRRRTGSSEGRCARRRRLTGGVPEDITARCLPWLLLAARAAEDVCGWLRLGTEERHFVPLCELRC